MKAPFKVHEQAKETGFKLKLAVIVHKACGAETNMSFRAYRKRMEQPAHTVPYHISVCDHCKEVIKKNDYEFVKWHKGRKRRKKVLEVLPEPLFDVNDDRSFGLST